MAVPSCRLIDCRVWKERSFCAQQNDNSRGVQRSVPIPPLSVVLFHSPTASTEFVGASQSCRQRSQEFVDASRWSRCSVWRVQSWKGEACYCAAAIREVYTEAVSAEGGIAAASGSVGGIATRTAIGNSSSSQSRGPDQLARRCAVECSVEEAGPTASVEGEPVTRCKAASIGLRCHC